LAGIKFGDFGQNTTSFNLVSFKFGDSAPNVMSPLQFKPSLEVDWVLVAHDFKLRKGLGRAVFVGKPYHPCLSRLLRGDTELIGPTGRSLLPQERSYLISDKKFLPRERVIADIALSGEYISPSTGTV